MSEEPSARRSIQNSSPENARVNQEIKELFKDGAIPATAPGTAEDFVARASRSKVAIVIPMFGYWGDVENGFLDQDTLEASISRARSYAHNAYVLLLAEPKRIPIETAKVLNKSFIQGNAKGVAMESGASYGDYIRKGISVALNETDAQYIVFLNPWAVIQDHGVDTLIDRINIPDNAPVICGYEMHDKIAADDFLKYKANVPVEQMMLTLNFFGMARYIAEMCQFDPDMKTPVFLERDFFQSVASRHFSAVSSERVPIFSFAFDWRQYIPLEDFHHDAAVFQKKWKFLPEDIKYER